MHSFACTRTRPFAATMLTLTLALSSAPSVPAAESSGSPDYLLRGDFDADGFEDTIAAARGDRRLAVLYGDAQGRVVRSETVALSGALTALAVADVNRRDGLEDVLAGVDDRLLVFEGAEGALRAKPESIVLPGEALEIVAGQFEGNYAIDVAVRTAEGDYVVRGRDRRLSLEGVEREKVRNAVVREATEAAARAFSAEPEAQSLASFVVTNTNDAGAGSLRQAILDANATPGADSISFNIPGAGVVHTIAPLTDLPPIDDAVRLDGTTQPGFAGTPLIELTGSNTLINGLNVRADHSVVRGLCVNRFRQHGIDVFSADNVLVEGNYIGTDPTGTQARGNTVFGLYVENSNNVQIGGTTAAARNVISANDFENVRIASGPSTGGHLVQGNYIGTTASGTQALPNLGQFNASGIAVFSPNTTVGGTSVAARNVVSGNRGAGIAVDFFSFGQDGHNLVQGNFVGVGATGAPLGNGKTGVFLGYTTEATVGGATASARNVISANGGAGVKVDGNLSERNRIQGNFIGTNVAGTSPLANGGDGVFVTGGSRDTTVGGPTLTPGAAPGNVISGNAGHGVSIAPLPPVEPNPEPTPTGPGFRTVVQGNLIGMRLGGAAVLPNQGNGVLIKDARNSTIGGTTAQARNVISGNGAAGVLVEGSHADRNVVQGNYLGTNAAGTARMPNGTSGVVVTGDAGGTTIGGLTATPGVAPGNVLSGNGDCGVTIEPRISGVPNPEPSVPPGPGHDTVIQGNLIGTKANGAEALFNQNNGIRITGGKNNTIGGAVAGARNVVSGNIENGIVIQDFATENVIQGNFVGLDVTGAMAIPNNADGMKVESSNTTIGGTTAEARNVVSGNGNFGIHVGLIAGGVATGAVIQGNYVGLNAAGTAAVPNGSSGIYLDRASNCTVGGTTQGARNVISGNGLAGINVDGGGVDEPGTGTGNVIKGNFVGTDAAGTAGVGNGTAGIFMQRGAHANTIGGSELGAGNVVAFNSGAGVELDDILGFGTDGNLIARNSIHSNDGLGIDLTNAAGADGVTPNDAFDFDGGANKLQNFPVITLADASLFNITISGTLSSTPLSTFTVELFSSGDCDGSNGEGRTFLGTATVSTNRVGTGSFSVTIARRVAVSSVVTATATGAGNNTSEFSACQVVE
jgi:hypothetical protein